MIHFRSGTDLILLPILLLLGRLLFSLIQKALGSVISNHIGMKFNTIVPYFK